MLPGLLVPGGGRMRYRKKPVEVEAVQWTGENLKEIREFCDDKLQFVFSSIYINTLEGSHRVSLNDYIIKGIKGEFYPCKPDIFKATYEEVK